jgi:hypothetical protein
VGGRRTLPGLAVVALLAGLALAAPARAHEEAPPEIGRAHV